MTEIENPLANYGDKKLKRKFTNKYNNIYIHDLEDGLYPRATLYLMYLELQERGINPENCIN